MSFVITYSEPVYMCWLVVAFLENITSFLNKHRVSKKEYALVKGIQEYVEEHRYYTIKQEIAVKEVFKQYGYLNE